jgi:dTDP-4-dehydrorhamnose 3,5-epimerase
MPFIFQRTELPDVILIIPKVFEDERGFFIETFKKSDFEMNGIKFDFLQDNHSKSKKNVLRGLHYQLNPKPQGKLVRCIKGRIWDVCVDIRKGSPFFGKWFGCELSEENKHILWIPPSFAHGFVVLSEEAEVIYKATQEYYPELERGIIWNDPTININWPVKNPILSKKDASLPNLQEAENNFVYEEKKIL